MSDQPLAPSRASSPQGLTKYEVVYNGHGGCDVVALKDDSSERDWSRCLRDGDEVIRAAEVDQDRARLRQQIVDLQRERDEAHRWRTSLTQELIASDEALARLRQRVRALQAEWRAKEEDGQLYGSEHAIYRSHADALDALLEAVADVEPRQERRDATE